MIKQCQQYGVSLFLLKQNFLLYAALTAEASGNYLLRQKQYTRTTDFEIAKHLVFNKLYNQQILLNNFRNKKEKETCAFNLQKQIQKITESKQLLGFEGTYTKIFFKNYFAEINWRRRLPRTKYDEINMLMDIGYTMLFNYIDALLSLYGFDSYKGVYHTLFFQRKSLACDIMEPFRSIIEKKILKSFRLKQIDEKDFTIRKGKYELSFENQKKYIRLFSDAIMNHNEAIFSYVRDYYYCIFNDATDYPIFEIQ